MYKEAVTFDMVALVQIDGLSLADKGEEPQMFPPPCVEVVSMNIAKHRV
jgi:hypothetical protein